MRPIVRRAAGLTQRISARPAVDHALLAGTIADPGWSPKQPPDQADEFVKHRCLPRPLAEDPSWPDHIADRDERR